MPTLTNRVIEQSNDSLFSWSQIVNNIHGE